VVAKHILNPFIDEHTCITLYKNWQALRRHSEYGPAMQACLQDMREHFAMLQAILAYYIPSDADARPYVGTEHATISHFVHMQSFLKNMDCLSRGLRSHPVLTTYEPGDAEAMAHAYRQAAPYPLEKRAAYALHSLCQPEHRDAFPLLARFAHTWNIRLPMDPAILCLPDLVAMNVFPRNFDQRNFEVSTSFQFSGPDYDPAGADEKVTITVELFPGAYRPAIREDFATRLNWAFPWEVDGHQPRGYQRRDLTYYMKWFAAYDLLHHDKHSYSKIARKLWPKEWEENQRNDLVRNSTEKRVSYAAKQAEKLIHAAKKR